MNIPKPNDKLDWNKFIIGNFAGRSAAPNTYGKTRPQTPQDFAAKIHDFQFAASELSIADAPYDDDPIKKSRLAKANYIFWLLMGKVREKSISKLIINVVGAHVLKYDEKDFLPNDGFQNVLASENLQSPEYLMIPFQKLSQKSQDKLTKVIYDDSFDGVGASGGGKKWIYDYNTAVCEDVMDWRSVWAEQYFAEAWDKAAAVE